MHLKSQDDGKDLSNKPKTVKSREDLQKAAKSGEQVTVNL